MTEVLILDKYFQGALLILACLTEAGRRVGIGDAVREIAIPMMDKRAIHLVDKLNFQNYGQEGEDIPFLEVF
jgi:hypothetical protein